MLRADMYLVKIKVITSRGNNDANPTVNWITPEPSMKQFAESKDVEVKEMVLLHEDECHFNLVVNEESDLALRRSLSRRLNVGPLLKESEDVVDDNKTGDVYEENDKSKVNDLEKELKKCRLEKANIEKEYLLCESELRVITEEFEKLKIELKDTKEICD